jgi:hypothetical protein
MIGQEVNSPAQKLLPSARRKRGALQGVNVLVNCSHVVPGLNGRSGKSVVRSHKQTIANISPANKRRDRTDYSSNGRRDRPGGNCLASWRWYSTRAIDPEKRRALKTFWRKRSGIERGGTAIVHRALVRYGGFCV